MIIRTTTALSLIALVLTGCGGDEAPAPEGALESIEQQTAIDNAAQQRAMENAQIGETPDEPTDAESTTVAQEGSSGIVTPDTSGVVASDGRIVVGNSSMALPQAWTEQEPSNQFRAAQYGVGETGQFVVFSGIGGVVEDNINRWIGQIGNPTGLPSRDVIRRDGLVIHTVSLTGTYQGMAGPAQDNTTFYGAIVEGANTPIQLRLTTSADRAESDAEWASVLDSIELN